LSSAELGLGGRSRGVTLKKPEERKKDGERTYRSERGEGVAAESVMGSLEWASRMGGGGGFGNSWRERSATVSWPLTVSFEGRLSTNKRGDSREVEVSEENGLARCEKSDNGESSLFPSGTLKAAFSQKLTEKKWGREEKQSNLS